MKKTILTLSLAAMALPAIAADEKKPEPDWTLTPNIGVVSDYRFRGVSQTDKKPAAQAGLDLVGKNGLYVGTWTSNVSSWANPGGSQELDIYGGYKKEVYGVLVDIGAIGYTYPHNKPATGPKNNTYEYYIGGTFADISLKYSRTTGNWFGIAASSARYLDLSYSLPITEKITAQFHVGRQEISSEDGLDYGFKDFKIGVAYDLGDGYSIGLAAIKTNMNKKSDADTWYVHDGKKLYEDMGVLSLTKTF